MRSCLLLLALCLLTSLAQGQVADPKKRAAEQKKTGEENWNLIEAGPLAIGETPHLLIFAPKSMAPRMKAIEATLERYHDLAFKVLGFDPKLPAYEGKITIYLLPERALLGSFVRQVEKKRLLGGEAGGRFAAEDDRLHALAIPMERAGSPPHEALAGEQLAALLLQRRAGVRTSVPYWVQAGFGRATSYRALPRERFVLEDRKLTRSVGGKRKAASIWDGSVSSDEAPALQGSLAEMLSYASPSRFPRFLEGFRPREGAATPTTVQALDAAKVSPETVEKAWKRWATTTR